MAAPRNALAHDEERPKPDGAVRGTESSIAAIGDDSTGAEAESAEANDDGTQKRPAGDDDMSFWTFFVLALGAGLLASCAAPIDSTAGGDDVGDGGSAAISGGEGG